ncbi:MAG: copper-translocating P-type ATPase [Chlamydiae bacterium]|nr:copper-translocating P-type ATPase [Chlamydiota bacterium]
MIDKMDQTKEYICPMHPQVVKSQEGSCDICGMALEPKNKEWGKNLELKKMVLRFWISISLVIPILILSMFGSYLSSRFGWAFGSNILIQAILATPIVLWCGAPLFKKGWYSIINLSFNMFTLISLGIGAAYLYSLIVVFLFFTLNLNLQMNVYFEAASVITALVLLGQVLELKVRVKAGDAIKKLLTLSPKSARIILEDGREEDVPLDDIKKGNKLRVRPGEKVPVDGKILEGSGVIDESMITGEPFLASKNIGDKVIGATINKSSSFIMIAEKVGKDTLLSQIIHLVSEAERSKAPIQKLADTVSSYFVPAVIIVAFLTFISWLFLGPSPKLAHALINSVAVLIIACPCALGLATPMSIMAGVGRGAMEGILIKNAEALEKMSKIDTVVFDKTGTLTEGKPKLTTIRSVSEKTEDELLLLAASLEIASEHPLALPIIAMAKEKNISLLPLKNFNNFSGKGIIGTINESLVAIGNKMLFSDLKIDISNLLEKSEDLSLQGQTILYLSLENKGIGIFAISDVIKDSTFEAVKMLHKEGIRLIMLTGDNKITAATVGKQLDIDEIEAEVLPTDKNKIINKLQEQGRLVAMAGDGINDAPALALADVGIAMGTGSDIAIESGGIILIKGDLRGVAKVRRLSILTMRNIRQNLWFAFIYNSLGVPIAAGILYPFFGLLLSPIIASLAMILSSVSVITNSLRLKKIKI